MKYLLAGCIIVTIIFIFAFSKTSLNPMNNPKITLICIIDDVNKKGAEGLKTHLTPFASNFLDKIKCDVSEEIFSVPIGEMSHEEYQALLKSKMKETLWKINDIKIYGDDRADVCLFFDCCNLISGCVHVDMVRDDSFIWKINDIRNMTVNV